ncbi:calcium-binding protein [Pseudooceanicola sp. HF7]|uniref:calcium-binding protein n=1 Tax=Pseudooceanicola sp. HF7 TaxID=2721560 RepID=UPI0014316ABF|nr:calcium-binding protein [Pseudooceanicola sp. HF7]NIZ08001.1 calcium-binding protein [Pseudooceanicola sp. HF7]
MSSVISFNSVASGEVVTERHFGSNYLANRQDHAETIETDGGFGDAADWLGITNYRYPGGTLAEKYFDITDKRHFEVGATDAIDVANFADPNETTTFTRLGTFLDFAAANDAEVTVVIPTIRFFEAFQENTATAMAEVEQMVKDFVHNAMTYPNGGVISGFELGNEFASWIAGHNGDLLSHASDFSAITRNLAVWVQEELDTMDLVDEPEIIAQTAFFRQGYRGNNQLVRNLLDDSLDEQFSHLESVEDFYNAIDGVSIHAYPHTPWEEETSDGVIDILDDIGLVDDWVMFMDEWAAENGAESKDLEVYATEWNIKSAAFKEGDVTGSQAGIGTVAAFHRLVREGVDEMQVWPVLQNKHSTLVDQEEDGSQAVSFGGASYVLLRELVEGYEVNEDQTAFDVDGDGTDDVFIYNFVMGDGNVVTFASSAYDVTVTLDYKAFGLDADPTEAHIGTFRAFEKDGETPIFQVEKTQILYGSNTSVTLDMVAWEMTVISVTEDMNAVTPSGTGGSTFTFATGDSYSDRLNAVFNSYVADHANIMVGENIGTEFQIYPTFAFDAGGGNDKVYGTAGNDTVLGGGGSDNMTLASGDDLIYGEVGNDAIFGGAGRDSISGGVGQDYLAGGADDDVIFGGDDSDTIHGDDGHDTLYGGLGNDSIYGDAGNDEIYGGRGENYLDGGNDDDTITGHDLKDTIIGGNGFDSLYGEAGNDLIYGMEKADNLYGGAGNDELYGGRGLDRIFGGEGDDVAYGDEHRDGISGGAGNDLIYGGDDDDRLLGDEGNDTIHGDAHRDRIFGGADNDLIYGGDDNDWLIGNEGHDTINGDAGDDTIKGHSGFDVINGGAGNDSMTGDFNADTFIFTDGFGKDEITDFEATNDFERIDLSGVSSITSFADLQKNHMAQVGNDVLIWDGNGNEINLLNVDIKDLDSIDFIL